MSEAEGATMNPRLLFVGGMHRSGTTAVARAISASPSFSGLSSTNVMMDEGQFLQDVYPTGSQLGGVTSWALNPRAHMTEQEAARMPAAGDRLLRAWNPYWDTSSAVLVEKTPLNLTKTRFLQAVFPGAMFVIITRHPITQALAVQKWAPTATGKLGYHFPGIIENWVVAHEYFDLDANHLERVHLMRYEDLVSDPDAELNRLDNFLSAKVDRMLLRFDRDRDQAYENRWRRALAGKGRLRQSLSVLQSIPRGRTHLTTEMVEAAGRLYYPFYAGRIAERFGARIQRLGYDVSSLAP